MQLRFGRCGFFCCSARLCVDSELQLFRQCLNTRRVALRSLGPDGRLWHQFPVHEPLWRCTLVGRYDCARCEYEARDAAASFVILLCASNAAHARPDLQADSSSQAIRSIVVSSAQVTTIAGARGANAASGVGCADGAGRTVALFNSPSGLAMDAAQTFAVIVR